MLKRIYVFECDNKYKIGVSKDTKSRLNQLKCALPNIKPVFESEYMSNPYKVETFLHHVFDCYSIGGEWFSEIDLEKIKDVIKMVSETEEKGISVSEEKRKEIDEHIHNLICGNIDNAVKEKGFEELKEENCQIEKFIQSIKGIDCPNIYSDLIYKELFGKNTEEFVKLYSPNRFESFRAKLRERENDKIDKLTMLVSSLINCGWGYEQIKEFLSQQATKMIE